MTTDPTAQQIKEKGSGDILLDMRTEQGTRDAPGACTRPARSTWTAPTWTPPRQGAEAGQRVREDAGLHQQPLPCRDRRPDAAEYAFGNGGSATYVAALDASKAMFTKNAVMDADGVKNVLQVLAASNPNVKGKADTVDLTTTYTTYTTDFVSKAPAACASGSDRRRGMCVPRPRSPSSLDQAQPVGVR